MMRVTAVGTRRWLRLPLSALVALLCGRAMTADAQPIPVELMVGHDNATTNLVVSRPFSPDSRLGFFHLSTFEMDYEDDSRNGMAVQNLMFLELPAGFRLTGGAFHSERGFSPTAGLQYIRAGRDLFLLVAPRANLETDRSYSLFSIVRYRPVVAGARLYLAAQLLNAFTTERHLRSYQWLRLGVEVRGTQFGLAVNLDQAGPSRTVTYNLGAFVRREIF